MPRPRFSEMLIDRRRQLGLTVAQASQVLRLKQQVIIAFEEGDFENMPKSGYAQGMLASYGRYLGLNTRVLISQFNTDLFEYEHGGGTAVRRPRNDEPLYEFPQNAIRRNASYEGKSGLLPTSGGYAGDLGSFATTSPVRSRNQSSPLVHGRSTYPSSSVEDRRYTGRDMYSAAERRSTQLRPRFQDASGYSSRYTGDEGMADRSSRDRVMTRRVGPSQYTDDLRYDDARPYEAASTTTGRRSSRNIAQPNRPNVRRRRTSSSGDPRRRNRRTQPQRSGFLGILQEFFSDRRRTMVTVTLCAALILTIIIISSVSSCIHSKSSIDRSVSVGTAQTTNTDDTQASQDSSSSSEIATETARAAQEAKAAQEEKEAHTQTNVEVSVADGEVTWLEITVDDTSIIAEQVSGPWDNSYTVTKSITVQVSNISAVTVKKNGTAQRFDSKTSGIGTLTIQGTKVKDTQGDTASTDDSEAAASDESQSQDAEGGSQNTSSNSLGTSSSGANSSSTSSSTKG